MVDTLVPTPSHLLFHFFSPHLASYHFFASCPAIPISVSLIPSPHLSFSVSPGLSSFCFSLPCFTCLEAGILAAFLCPHWLLVPVLPIFPSCVFLILPWNFFLCISSEDPCSSHFDTTVSEDFQSYFSSMCMDCLLPPCCLGLIQEA